MSVERDAQVKADATRIAMDYPEEQRATFIEDYIRASSRINNFVDARLSQFQRDAAELLTNTLRPALVEAILDLHTKALKDLTNRFIFATSRVGDPGLRRIIADVMPDIMETTMTALSDLDFSNAVRQGTKLI